MKNVFVTDNEVEIAPIVVWDGFLEAEYLTIVGNKGKVSDSIACDAEGDAIFVNSLILGDLGDTCDLFDGVVGGSHALIGKYLDPSTDGIYRAKQELKSTATWRWFNHYFDFDGDPRPLFDGAPDYAGADRPSE